MSKEKILKYLRNPSLIIFWMAYRGWIRILPDKLYLKILFRMKMGRWPDLDNPKTFNEKLQWLKLHDRNPEYTKMVDKYEVRKYIAETIGEEYLIPLLGVWECFDEIDFEQLPNQFVLKCTHDSGGLVICKDKSKLDIKKTRKKINQCLKRNYYWSFREWPYKNVKPRIIAEKYIEDGSGQLKDYKIFCFNGEPKVVQVDFDRFNGHKRNLYDTNWEYQPFGIAYPTHSEIQIEKPKNLELMLNFAKKMSFGIPHVRVDFYEISYNSGGGGYLLLFGELTFFHESGFGKFTPEEWDCKFGRLLDVR